MKIVNLVQSTIEVLDFDVVKAAEEELDQGSIENQSTHSRLESLLLSSSVIVVLCII